MNDNFYKEIVHVLAKESKCVSIKVGAVIVKNDRIISTGYNGTINGYKNCCEVFSSEDFDREAHHKWSKDHEIHAEQNALIAAAKAGIAVKNCTCYSSLHPCNMCLLFLIQAGIKEIVYESIYDKFVMEKEIQDLIISKGIILRKFKD